MDMDLWVCRYLRQITNDHLWPFRYCLPARRYSEGTLAQQISVLRVNHYLFYLSRTHEMIFGFMPVSSVGLTLLMLRPANEWH